MCTMRIFLILSLLLVYPSINPKIHFKSDINVDIIKKDIVNNNLKFINYCEY